MSSRRSELADATSKGKALLDELHQVEAQASGIDQQVVTLDQQGAYVGQAWTGLEGGYRRCLLESQKAQDAVDSLLEKLREEMGVTDPKELSSYTLHTSTAPGEIAPQNGQLVSDDARALSEEEEAYMRRLRRRVDALRGRLKTLGGRDPDATQQYEVTHTRIAILSS